MSLTITSWITRGLPRQFWLIALDLDLRGVHLYEVLPDQERGAGVP
jgi:hypothetical protein